MERWHTNEEIAEFIGAFEACTLPHAAWTHRAHLTVALWYLSYCSQQEATHLIRTGIQRYNEACGVITTDTSGYHETITLFFIWFVKRYLETNGSNRPLFEVASEFIERHGDKNLPLEYYSKGRLMSREARYGWVEPDLKPLA
ncbi:MAG TPA: hypothetical protein VFD58_13125 [Blastocatellia bacterium]|nr:hypothetical protein [Blastocatellia bacterium]